MITNQWRKKFSDRSDDIENGIEGKPFSESFLRGFNSMDCFTKERNVAIGAFLFGNHTSERLDNYHEASINWEDDSNAVTVLMNQKKEGTEEQMFKWLCTSSFESC